MTETSGQTYGFHPKKTKERYPRLAEEACNWILGPMPTPQFLRVFLNSDELDKGKMPSTTGTFAAVPEKSKRESEIYVSMVR